MFSVPGYLNRHWIMSLFVVLAVTGVRKTGANDCPDVPDKEKNMIKIDNMCYHYMATPEAQVTFAAAESDCEGRGGHLVTIKNNHTQAELVRILQDEFQVSSHTVLIGLQKEGSMWKWVTGEALSYSNWESAATCQDCDCAKLKLRMGGVWEKFNCQSSDWFTAYVCEYDPQTSGSGQNTGHPLTFLLILSTLGAVAMALILH